MIVKKDIHTFREAHRILLRKNDYAYILPHPALRGHISNYTVTFPSREIISDCYTVIPHGSATLVFSHDTDGWYGRLFGPSTKPCMVGALANQSRVLLIIEFQPAGLSAFTGVNQKELANQIVPFAAINLTLNRWILQALEGAESLDALIAFLDRRLLDNLHAAYPAELQIATKLVIERAGNVSGKELSAAVYYSQRHINRILEHHLGMNMKTFSRMVRVNKAVRLIQNPQYSLTRVSQETGFYDLAHLIHEFKSVCGITPQAYRSNMSDFYNEVAKF